MSKHTFKRGPGWLRSYSIVYLVFIYLPVFLLPLFSFNDAIYVAFPMKGFTLKWWGGVVDTNQYVKSPVAQLHCRGSCLYCQYNTGA